MMLEALLNNLFRYQPITGVTINCVYNTPALRTAVLIVLATAFAAGLVAAQAKGHLFLAALRRAAIIAFFAGGLAYSLHADLGWSQWLAADHNAFAGKTTDQKLRVLVGPLYDFAHESRKVLQDDYRMPNDGSDNYLARRFEYFVLPLRMRADAPYIVVLGDREATFDRKARTYTRGDMVVRDVDLVLPFMSDAYVLKLRR